MRAQGDCFGLWPRNDGDASTVLIVAAVSLELQNFQSQRDSRVQCLVTGMGRRAGEAVRRRLAKGDIRLVVSVGFAAGASAGLRVGDLVMASEVVDESDGRRLRPSIPPERMVEGTRACPPAPRRAGLPVVPWRVGPFVTVSRPAVTPSDKRRRSDQFGAIAVEMETSAVAAAAVESGTRWLSLRAILDPMETSLAVTSAFQAVGLMVQPWQWSRLAEFMESVRVAGESLARGLELLLERLGSRY